ncbi:cytochrome b/b6 domain-containing protein [Rheinheimera sp. MMS21-TC3]|uniref:cytochrome b/b6 domain-containing protein n=1 Tax=Rheinheimera sp. MMS21-TC3 TaxID=3072790 RepID=UPI0028C3D8AE|nr:cytochrome b/b6 domain-containing protein [Rheinheimera sp. MMS21-TC3]WNO59925.1 cytochrome b/b6 domain-containing protein [Rheinheimera sp. MMS21-TC3]
MAKYLLIWDPLVRVCHWILVLAFTLNYFLLEPGSNPHQVFGYIALTTILVRIVWATITTNYASFKHLNLHYKNFALHYSHLRSRNIPSQSGHNPIGWLMIISTWLLVIGLATTGFILEEIDYFFGNSLIKNIHSIFANTLYAIVLIHIIAIILVSWWGKISLLRPMITGKRKS